MNDTGVSYCRDSSPYDHDCLLVAADTGTHPRQDARYGRDAAAEVGKLTKVGGGNAGFDFTALDANGHPTTPLPSTNPHSCVRDNVTGLVWEVKTTDGGLRDQKWLYSWFDSVHNYGGNSGKESGGISCKTIGRCDTEKYVADVNAIALCGFSDWRMPTVDELLGIVDYGQSKIEGTFPFIDRNYFPNSAGGGAAGNRYWTASPYGDPNSKDRAWLVYFSDGSTHHAYRNLSYGRVRLVRGKS
jgi:hypothetical protein